MLALSGFKLGPAEDEHLNQHPFNRLAPRGQAEIEYGCFRFFPYGFTFRMLGLGPTDAFGHRICGNFRAYRSRDRQHKLIVCFGGSAVWGQHGPVIPELSGDIA